MFRAVRLDFKTEKLERSKGLNTHSSVDHCQPACEEGRTMFELNGQSACLKNQGKMRSDQGHATCDSVGGYVPQEQTTQYRSDKHNYSI